MVVSLCMQSIEVTLLYNTRDARVYIWNRIKKYFSINLIMNIQWQNCITWSIVLLVSYWEIINTALLIYWLDICCVAVKGVTWMSMVMYMIGRMKCQCSTTCVDCFQYITKADYKYIEPVVPVALLQWCAWYLTGEWPSHEQMAAICMGKQREITTWTVWWSRHSMLWDTRWFKWMFVL